LAVPDLAVPDLVERLLPDPVFEPSSIALALSLFSPTAGACCAAEF